MVALGEDLKKFTLAQLLAHVCRLVGHRRRMKMESIGLHYAQGLILFKLWQQDGISQSELAQALHITSPTATNTLKRMQRDGWVDRRRDESDQRIVRVYLTEKAQTLRAEARASFRELDHEMTSILTEKEHQTLRKSLLKVHRYLTSATGPAPGSGQPADPKGQEKIR